ncbi:NACHT domain-containing protein [Methylomonas albis]|uniref:NACHT domain-containing protein n=1 Tax=Methylomonas albis TaxID=1854563 RepID=A0ABR9CW92_9GAMM|nr:NACHT domain-containing protein [Methylomonas albis]MBD9354970.1 NACHT domain-containing protein [Methylomonas albis]
MSRKLTWLHLSDFHARQRDGWDSRQITDALVCDLKQMQIEHGLCPDLIFFTGDLVFGAVSGESMDDQYQLVRDFLDAIRKAFIPEIPIRSLYLVPGNHDVDRNEITPDQTAWIRQPNLKLDDVITMMRDENKQWQRFMERLLNYRNFLTSYNLLHLLPGDPHLIWTDALEIHNTRVGIAGLNSAWSCADDNDKAKIWLGGDWQINQLRQRMGPVDFSFALIHHPGNWFTASEDPSTMRRLKQEFEIILHGHEHQEWLEFNDDGRLILSAGACYESSRKPNGYSFGQVDFDHHSGGVWLRQWDSMGRGWVSRNIARKTKDGFWPISELLWLKKLDKDAVDPPQPVDRELRFTEEESVNTHFTQRYCEFVVNQYDTLELFGCDIPKKLQKHQLSVAYVSLNLARDDDESASVLARNQEAIKKLTESEDSGNEKLQLDISDTSTAIEYVLDRVSANSGRLLINGPAGAGKSTLLRWCAIHAARQVLSADPGELPDFDTPKNPIKMDLNSWGLTSYVKRESETWRLKIPFLIRLRDCPQGRLPPANQLPSMLAKHLPNAPSNWMTSVLYAGQALILFDGVDEIHLDQRPLLAQEIEELIRTYPRCTYVVSTRPGAVEPGWLAGLDFIEARVEPMSRTDRDEFIEKWYRSAALELKLYPRPGEDLNRTARQLKRELNEQPELGLLASNPLLCAMICALYRERQEKLPETPAELSEALCHMLLHRRERETPGLDDKHFSASWRALQYPQKKILLEIIAWWMVSNGKSSIELRDAELLVAEALPFIPGRTEAEASEVVQALVERSGMLRPASDDRIDFLHNTLKEYLAATRVVEANNWQILTKHADDPSWQPVILFALALAQESFSSSLVKSLLDKITSSKVPTKKGALNKQQKKALVLTKSRQFFLVRCRAAAKQLASDLTNKIDGFLDSLLPPTSMNEVEALALLGPKILNYGVDTLESSSWWNGQNGHMATRCLRLLRLVGGSKAKTALKSINSVISNSSQLICEWILVCNELFPGERLPWPFLKTESLWLSSGRITDISLLEDLTHLKQLFLHDTYVTSLNPLVKLTSLQHLSIFHVPVRDIGPLGYLKSLQYLRFTFSPVSNVKPLAGLKELKTLICDYTEIQDISDIAELVSLERLDLDSCPIENIEPLCKLVSLRQLSLQKIQAGDFNALVNLCSLESLNLRGTKITSLVPLHSLISLQRLNLEATEINDFNELKQLNALQYLNLSNTNIIDLAPLAQLNSLNSLLLNYTRVNDLSPISALKSLENIFLHNLNVYDLSPLIGIKSLKRIQLGKTGILEKDLEIFKQARPDVKFIYL